MNEVKRALYGFAAAALWLTAQGIRAQAEPARDDIFEVDFENTSLADWSVDVEGKDSTAVVAVEAVDGGHSYLLTGPAVAKLEGEPNTSRVQIKKTGGDAALHVQGPVTRIEKHFIVFAGEEQKTREDTIHRHVVLATLPGAPTDTFELRFDVRGEGGVAFGDGYKVFVDRVGDLGKLKWTSPFGTGGELSLRFLTLSDWNRLTVVCTPSFIRIYREDLLVGDIVLDGTQTWPRGVVAAPVALFGQDVFFDNVKMSCFPSPLDACVVVPAPPENVKPEAYAFPAGADVTVDFDVLNYGAEDVQFGLAVDEFSQASRKDAGKAPLKGNTDRPKRVTFELGRMKPGFYQMHLTFTHADKTFGSRIWPLAVLRSMGGRKEDFVRPILPVGPYLAAMRYCRTREPFYGNTYIRKVLDDLKHHGFTAFVECGRSFSEANLDLCQKYGIAVWDRGLPRDHPVVLGGLVGDEPSTTDLGWYVDEYKKLRAERKDPEQFLITNVIADGMLSCINNFFWDVIEPRLRFSRIYSCSGATTTRDNLRLIGRSISYPGQLLNLRNYGDTPYSIIIPTFGDGGPKAYYRDPTPAETKLMTHLSLAYGAKAVSYYTWQSQTGLGGALVDATGLRPLDGKLMALAEEVRKIQSHAELIRSLEPDAARVFCSTPWVEAVPLKSGGDTYVYAVNRNIRSHTRADLFWDPERRLVRAHDVYADQSLQISGIPFGDGEMSKGLRLDLLPGEGKLLAVEVKP